MRPQVRLLAALISAAFASEAGAAAGRTEFIIGGATVARDGVERPLARGTELDNGDVVRTNDGRVQIRFNDGAYVSLQPNTEFGIREYRYEGKTDGSERGFFGLLKGAMRTVTGAIGRINRNAYRITTPTATVGIRGTGGLIQVLPDGSTLVNGTSGIWFLQNPAGSIDVPAGSSGLAPADPNTPPTETTQQPTSGAAPLPPEEPIEFVQGEERSATGEPVLPVPTFTPLLSGSGYATSTAFDVSFFSPFIESGTNVTATFDAAGQLTSMTYADPFGFGTFDFALNSGASHADFGSDGILAWGRWIGPVTVTPNCDGPCSASQDYGPNQGFHYVIGMPVFPTMSGTYTLLGATRPTYADGSTAPGALSGQLVVTLSASPIVALQNFTITMPDNTYQLAGSAIVSTPGVFSMNPSVTSGCRGSCSALAEGLFAGQTGNRAGLVFHVGDVNTSSGIFKDLFGAGTFQRQ